MTYQFPRSGYGQENSLGDAGDSWDNYDPNAGGYGQETEMIGRTADNIYSQQQNLSEQSNDDYLQKQNEKQRNNKSNIIGSGGCVGDGNNNNSTSFKDRQAPFSFITDPTINQFLIQINPDLFISKMFYFFFYSAFGSLFPLMAVYFKQLGMNPIQAGTLIGIRPFVEYISAPFWSSIADRFRKYKAILLFSLVCWIVFTFSQAFIRPPASACVIFNETHHILYSPYSDSHEQEDIVDDTVTLWPITDNNESSSQIELTKTSKLSPTSDSGMTTVTTTTDANTINPVVQAEMKLERFRRASEEGEGIKKWGVRHRPPPNHIVGKSPLTVEYTLNYNKDKHISYVSPPFSTIVYKLDDVKEVFFLLFLLVLLGEFFSAPALTLADTATLGYLGEDTDKYGQQRMYGSFGWGITMFLVGIALDNSTKFKDHPCEPHTGERNYVTCFTIFSILMACTLFVSTKFRFQADELSNERPTEGYSNDIQMNKYDYDAFGPKPWQNTSPAINVPKEYQQPKKSEFIDRWKSAVFAQRARGLPNWVAVLRCMNNRRRVAFLFVTWTMGFGVGLVFSFLFWHLQDLGGTPTLYGLASVINHISEIGAFFFSVNLIRKFGHTKVLCAGLMFNTIRFLYVAWLDNPWWVLPFELIQGVTHASVWAAACSYITHNTDSDYRGSAQGVMTGIYQGLGRGSGAILGGVIINKFGSRVTFLLYGLFCAAILGIFVHLNYYRKNEGYNFEEETVDEVIFDESNAPAPHGVPSIPIARSVSRQNMNQNNGNDNRLTATLGSSNQETTQYQSTNTWDPNEAWDN